MNLGRRSLPPTEQMRDLPHTEIKHLNMELGEILLGGPATAAAAAAAVVVD